MFKKMKKKKKGFTLVELVVVVAILGILAGIAIPKFGSIQTDAANAVHNANIRTLQSAAMMYLAANGNPAAEKTYDKDSTDGVLDYLQSWPVVPVGAKAKAAVIDKATREAGYIVKIDENGVVTITPEAATINK